MPSTRLSYPKHCRKALGYLVEVGAIRLASGRLLRSRSGWKTAGYPRKSTTSTLSSVRGIRELDTHMVDKHAKGIYVALFRGLWTG